MSTNRNTECEWCDRPLTLTRQERNDLHLRLIAGRDTRFGQAGEVPHCATCHAWTHYACDQCGGCLPDLGDGLRASYNGVKGQAYANRRYCSNACRQRAYRARRDDRLYGEIVDGELVT